MEQPFEGFSCHGCDEWEVKPYVFTPTLLQFTKVFFSPSSSPSPGVPTVSECELAPERNEWVRIKRILKCIVCSNMHGTCNYQSVTDIRRPFVPRVHYHLISSLNISSHFQMDCMGNLHTVPWPWSSQQCTMFQFITSSSDSKWLTAHSPDWKSYSCGSGSFFTSLWKNHKGIVLHYNCREESKFTDCFFCLVKS